MELRKIREGCNTFRKPLIFKTPAYIGLIMLSCVLAPDSSLAGFNQENRDVRYAVRQWLPQNYAVQGFSEPQLDVGNKSKWDQEVTSVQEDWVKAVMIEAEGGDITAQKRLGNIYTEGIGVPKNLVEAAKWYRKAAEQGDDTAQEKLGDIYAEGLGVPNDDVEAVKWYRKSALQGNEASKSKVEKFEIVSFVLNQKEAEGGDAAALKRLGDMYVEGRYVARNLSEAMKIYRRSAELEYVKAYVAIGSMYAKGLGVQKDEIEAEKWYKRADEKGDAEAENEIKNLEAISPAINKRNAKQGDVNAMIRLADLYSEGKSTTKNVNEAKKWYKLAARKKEKDADYDSAIDLYKKAGDKDGVRRVDRLMAKKKQEARRSFEQRARNDRKYLCNAARNYEESHRYSLSEQISAGQSFTQAVISYYGAAGFYSIAERYGKNSVDYVLRTECR